MMTDISNTILAESAQLNADDLISGEIIITITDVRVSNSPEQPVTIDYKDSRGKPWKPCKSMRRVLVHLWGADSKAYVGRSIALFRDASVKWAGQEVGGIRIAAMSDIPESVKIPLTLMRGVRRGYSVEKLEPAKQEHMQRNESSSSAPIQQKSSEDKARDWKDGIVRFLEKAQSREDVLSKVDLDNPSNNLKAISEKFPAIFDEIKLAQTKALHRLVVPLQKELQDDIPF